MAIVSEQRGWSDRRLSVFRWVVVAIYATIVGGTSLGNLSAGDVVFNAVIGVICLAAIVFAGWINAAERRDR